MKILITGLGGHGKTHACGIIKDNFGIKFADSSKFLAEKVIYPLLKDKYSSVEECYEDRHSGDNRIKWFKAITDYNTPDKSRLVKEILKEHDIYCGLRSIDELKASKNLFDLVVWIDAEERLGVTESSKSMTIPKSEADIVITNNGTKEEFERKVKKVFSLLMTNSQPSEGVEKTLDERKKDFYNEVAKHKDKYSRRELTDFYNYWTEHSDLIRKNTKMKFEKQTTFHVGRRLARWRKQGQKYSIVGMVKGFNKRKG